ncbi:MAG TPA: hypothetical protein VHR66_01030 [Gemmataceae bacterium]|jgi:hypothetical protein|nr:hypothetical protein [Gemmataceae bacterium]
MVKRRSLTAGITKPDPKKEREFVYGKDKAEGKKPKPTAEANAPASHPPEASKPRPSGRVPVTTRLRADIGTELKRASLERQLSGTKPNTVQEIIEAALEPWLKDNGYLK